MSSYRVARRYASALLQSAKENEELDAVAEAAELIAKTVRESRDLRVFLSSPIIEKQKKRKVLKELFAKRVGPNMMMFLDLIVEKDREAELLGIVEEFGRLFDESRGIVRVEVRSAVELAPDQRKRLEEQLEHYTGKKVVPQYHRDPTVLAGFVVHLDDRIIDASLAHQLDILKEKFLHGSAVGETGAK
jgi:F-type H+-transporting ATPase subunit delta